MEKSARAQKILFRPVGSIDDKHLIYIQQPVLKKLMRWAADNRECAALYGAFSPEEGFFISAACRIKKAERQMGQLVFTGKTLKAMREEKGEKYPRLEDVGWCVMHSDDDCPLPMELLDIARAHFAESGQLTVVLNPVSWQCRFYRWDENGELTEIPGFYLVSKQEEEPTAALEPEEPEEEMPIQATAAQETSITAQPTPAPMESASASVFQNIQEPVPAEETGVSMPKELVEQIRSHRKKLRTLTVCVAALGVCLLSLAGYVAASQFLSVQPASARQDELQQRLAVLEQRAGDDGSFQEAIADIYHKIGETQANSEPMEKRVDELLGRVEELEKQLEQSASAPASQAAALPKTHLVQRGETLSSISQMYYGTPAKASYLAKINNLKNPNHLITGTVLIVLE